MSRLDRRLEIIRLGHIDEQKIADGSLFLAGQLRDAVENMGRDLPSRDTGRPKDFPPKWVDADESDPITQLHDQWRDYENEKLMDPFNKGGGWARIDARLRKEGFDPTTADERATWDANPPTPDKPLPSQLTDPVFWLGKIVDAAASAYASIFEAGEAVIAWAKDRLQDAKDGLEALGNWLDRVLDTAYDALIEAGQST